MERTAWICVGKAYRNKDWYREDTISYTKKESIRLLLEGTVYTWEESKAIGWRCIKVTITIKSV